MLISDVKTMNPSKIGSNCLINKCILIMFSHSDKKSFKILSFAIFSHKLFSHFLSSIQSHIKIFYANVNKCELFRVWNLIDFCKIRGDQKSLINRCNVLLSALPNLFGAIFCPSICSSFFEASCVSSVRRTNVDQEKHSSGVCQKYYPFWTCQSCSWWS